MSWFSTKATRLVKENRIATVSKILKTTAVMILMVAGISTGAQGFVPGGTGAFGGETRGPVQLRGTVVCARCTLDEVRKAQPKEHALYELAHRQGQVVMKVTWVNNSQRWRLFAWPPRLWVRAKDEVFQQLTAEENLMKEIEIIGLLNNPRTLDIFELTVRG
jgi:hypothetical protein